VKQVVNLSHQHAKYADSPDHIRAIVDKAFTSVVETLRESGMRTSMCDGAEELVAAIFHYLHNSNPSLCSYSEPPIVRRSGETGNAAR
jgi:hypothetical protein